MRNCKLQNHTRELQKITADARDLLPSSCYSSEVPSNPQTKRNGVFMNKKLCATAMLLMSLTMFSCSAADPYREKFLGVSIGQKRLDVIRVMGEPTSQSAIEVPLIEVEMLAWHAPFAGATYTVHFVLQHAVSKSVIK